MMATNALLVLDDEDAKRDLLPSIAAGRVIATLAVARTAVAGMARRSPRRRRSMETVGGSTAPKTLVVDGVNADLLTVVAQAGGELGFFTVDGNAPGVSRTR